MYVENIKHREPDRTFLRSWLLQCVDIFLIWVGQKHESIESQINQLNRHY